MIVEKVETIWSSGLLKQPKKVYRVPLVRGRSYYTLDDENNPSFYCGATSVVSQWGQKGEAFYRKQCEMGYDGFKKYVEERSEYGTFFHICCGKLISDGIVPKQYIEQSVSSLCAQLNIPNMVKSWTDEMCKDVLAFRQFLIDYKVKPLAIEFILTSSFGVATPIDLICEMTIEEKGEHGEVYKSGEKKGQPKETKVERKITTIINMKSGKKGFFPDHAAQLAIEKMIFEENFPNIKIDKIYNLAPKEWINSPTYSLKDQTDALEMEKAKHLLALGAIDLKSRLEESSVTIFPDTIGEGEVQRIKIRDWIKDYHTNFEMAEAEIFSQA